MSQNSEGISIDVVKRVRKSVIPSRSSWSRGKSLINKVGISKDIDVAIITRDVQNILLGSLSEGVSGEFTVEAFDVGDGRIGIDLLQALGLDSTSLHRVEFLATLSLQGTGTHTGILQTHDLSLNLLPVRSDRGAVSLIQASWNPSLGGWYLETRCIEECRQLGQRRVVCKKPTET